MGDPVMKSEVKMRTARRLLGWSAVLGAAFLLMAASSPQCARSSDAPLGFSAVLGPETRPGGCVENCAGPANQARRAERARFLDAIRNCQDGGCRQTEAAMHASIMQQIAADQAVCVRACHNQGAGSGGN
jgi:hypothetical protein